MIAGASGRSYPDTSNRKGHPGEFRADLLRIAPTTSDISGHCKKRPAPAEERGPGRTDTFE